MPPRPYAETIFHISHTCELWCCPWLVGIEGSSSLPIGWFSRDRSGLDCIQDGDSPVNVVGEVFENADAPG